MILNFVLENGSKWAILSRIIGNRTEHAVKNRFFSLISAHIDVPIRKIKKEIDYLNSFLIFDTLQYHSQDFRNLDNNF